MMAVRGKADKNQQALGMQRFFLLLWQIVRVVVPVS